LGDLVLKGNLNLMLNLRLKGDGGKVLIGAHEALVELTPPGDPEQGTSPAPVLIPPPPAAPADSGLKVWVVKSFNSTVLADTRPIVALGMVMQGLTPTWPGMMLPSSGNTETVTINHLPINVVNDKAILFPNGASAPLTTSGQG
jgi:hypothetical protein